MLYVVISFAFVVGIMFFNKNKQIVISGLINSVGEERADCSVF